MLKWIWIGLCIVFIILVASCSLAETLSSPGTPVANPTLQAVQGRCGDGICDHRENPNNCSTDCSVVIPSTEVVSDENSAIQGPDNGSFWVINPTTGNRIYVLLVYPDDWSGEDLPTLVLVPGGSGDSSGFLDPPKNTAATLANEGYLVVLFDPEGRGKSEGQEDNNGSIHQDGLAQVIRFAAGLSEAMDGQIGLISFSYGVTMATGALARYPDLPVVFLVDWEGPADRNDTGGCDEDHMGHLQDVACCSDEVFWSEREAIIFIPNIQVPYQRLQSQKDHAQPDIDHAIAMVNAAVAGDVPWVRLNDLSANQVLDVHNLPPMLPDSMDKDLARLIVPYLEELFSYVE